MKKPRTAKEQAIITSRVAAGTRLQTHRPKVHADEKSYNRTREKRRWHRDQEALSHFEGAAA